MHLLRGLGVGCRGARTGRPNHPWPRSRLRHLRRSGAGDLPAPRRGQSAARLSRQVGGVLVVLSERHLRRWRRRSGCGPWRRRRGLALGPWHATPCCCRRYRSCCRPTNTCPSYHHTGGPTRHEPWPRCHNTRDPTRRSWATSGRSRAGFTLSVHLTADGRRGARPVVHSHDLAGWRATRPWGPSRLGGRPRRERRCRRRRRRTSGSGPLGRNVGSPGHRRPSQPLPGQLDSGLRGRVGPGGRSRGRGPAAPDHIAN